MGSSDNTAVALAKGGHAEEGLAALLAREGGNGGSVGRDDGVLARGGGSRGGRGAAALVLEDGDLSLAVGAVEDTLEHGVDVLAVGNADVVERGTEVGRHVDGGGGGEV